MSDQNSQQQVDASNEERKIQEVIDGVTKKGKKRGRKFKLEKGMIKKVFKAYQYQFLITIIMIVVIIVLLTISYKTNPYINSNQEESIVCRGLIELIER